MDSEGCHLYARVPTSIYCGNAYRVSGRLGLVYSYRTPLLEPEHSDWHPNSLLLIPGSLLCALNFPPLRQVCRTLGWH